MVLGTPALFRMQEHKWLSFKQLYARSVEDPSKEVGLAILALAGESQILDATAGMKWGCRRSSSCAEVTFCPCQGALGG